jgi:hypothetical protein
MRTHPMSHIVDLSSFQVPVSLLLKKGVGTCTTERCKETEP